MASDGPVSSSGPAVRYAAALYGYATDEGRLETVIGNTEKLGRLIDENPDLQRVIASPLTDAKQAHGAMRAIIRDQSLGIITRRFVDVMIANRRLALLPAALRAFAALVAERRGITTAYIASAHALTDVQQQQLRGRIIALGYGNVRMEQTVDRSLLGGLVVRIGARLYDTSLKSRLQRLQYAMKGAA